MQMFRPATLPKHHWPSSLVYTQTGSWCCQKGHNSFATLTELRGAHEPWKDNQMSPQGSGTHSSASTDHSLLFARLSVQFPLFHGVSVARKTIRYQRIWFEHRGLFSPIEQRALFLIVSDSKKTMFLENEEGMLRWSGDSSVKVQGRNLRQGVEKACFRCVCAKKPLRALMSSYDEQPHGRELL